LNNSIKSNQLENTTETNLNWHELEGKVRNESGAAMLNKAQIEYNHLKQLKRNQHLIGTENPNQVKIEVWSQIHEAQYKTCEDILANISGTHAICEVRERKRNSVLGLLPTTSELAEILNQPKPEQLEHMKASDKQKDIIAVLEETQANNLNAQFNTP
jgi:ERCC4-type nuclease